MNCWSPLLANAPHVDLATRRGVRNERAGSHAPALSGHLASGRINGLNRKEPRFVRVRAYLLTLLQEGYDSQLLDYWLDALCEDTIIEGMPADLIVTFYGEPVDRRSFLFEGVRAELWSIVRRPNQGERVIVSGSRVIRVGV